MSTKIIGGVILGILLILGIVLLMQPNPKKETVEKPIEVTQTPTKPIVKAYTIAEVANHATETDCWMVIENKVYDVTKFIPNHPGGKLIIGGCGKDATTLFNERPTNNKGPHPESAKTALTKMYIGNLQ